VGTWEEGKRQEELVEMEKKKPDTIWVRLEHLPRQYYFGLLIILICAVIIHPIGLPISIGKETKEFYDKVNALPNGSKVLLSIEMDPAAAGELNPGLAILMHQLFQKNIRILFFPSIDPIYPQMYVQYVEKSGIPEEYGKKYGTDYMAYGYLAGAETAMATLAKDMLFPTVDVHQNKLSDLPIMSDVHTYKDVVAVIIVSSLETNWWVRQWGSPYGVPLFAVVTMMMIPTVNPFYFSGQIKALMSGATGAPGYELLMGIPGDGLKNTDALSVSQLFVLALIVLGNLGLLIGRRKRANDIYGH
jgi:hypothetical protein